ncbi:MAG: hypothetical protein UR30_C0005G0081 [Candidatus Peregrinibacteria bacterium GW2011_GWC2_33_13]|nr:MAG: hypothetical protein UR30_C0005G0081 [Candidatus Peregrinibacteria bacterium GW2011_GWC2_33_13]
MTKIHLLSTEAERMYVIEQMTFEEIASKLNTNERTLRRWGATGDWNTKRELYLKSRQMFHERLYSFAQKIMDSIEKDLDNGEKIDYTRMNTFARVLPSIIKVKEYEDIASKKESSEEKKGLTPEAIRLIEEEILGISHDDSNNEAI